MIEGILLRPFTDPEAMLRHAGLNSPNGNDNHYNN